MARGRPKTPLAERISNKLTTQDTCLLWAGHLPAQIDDEDGHTRQVARLIFKVRYGETLHDSCKPERECGNPRCFKVDHFTLKPRNQARWEGFHPPIAWEREQTPSQEDQINELLDIVQSMDDRPPSPEALVERWNGDVTLEEAREIYRRIT